MPDDNDDLLLDDDTFAPLDQQEDEADLDLKENWFHGAVLWSTDWTTETILSQLARGNIDLKPRYQRRSAWRDGHKSSFIESLILGLPIPQLILAEDKNRKGSFIVIDGKQRLLSLRQFAATNDDEFRPLRLSGLKDRPDLIGKRYQDLKDDIALFDERNTFENQTIRTVVIRNWKSEKYLYSVFLRINTGSVKLSPQELRQAVSPGPFSDFIDEFSLDSVPLREALGLRQPDFRMRDTELALRFFAYKNYLESYTGNLKLFLDNFTISSNRNWDSLEKKFQSQGKTFNSAILDTKDIFGEKFFFRKWNGNEFERRINRAVFDIMMFYFADPKISQVAKDKKEEIVSAFKTLCTSHDEFRSSIEQTTKSIGANATRMGVWGETLKEILKLNFPIPKLLDNKIVI